MSLALGVEVLAPEADEAEPELEPELEGSNVVKVIVPTSAVVVFAGVQSMGTSTPISRPMSRHRMQGKSRERFMICLLVGGKRE